MKSEIKYKIKDANSTFLLTEVTLTIEMYNPLNVGEAFDIVKKHYKDWATEGKIKINKKLDELSEKDNISISKDMRKEMFNNFYFYDEATIRIISINNVPFEELEQIEFEVASNRLKEKLESLSKTTNETTLYKTEVDKLVDRIELLNYHDRQELISRIK